MNVHLFSPIYFQGRQGMPGITGYPGPNGAKVIKLLKNPDSFQISFGIFAPCSELKLLNELK